LNESLLISQLNELKPAGARVYLVGGAVRDILLQRTGKDFDLACSFDTRIIARALADRQKGDFYLLDAKRNTSRVILHESNGRRVFYDFARLQGSSIEDDLQTRDFTINAMALDLDAPDALIDPQGGARDLKDRILRACSPNSFADDPVRVIRAVRYAIGLDLTITPETLMGLKAAVPLVNQISRERNRDELLKGA
jgi:tRNA nucleotidyltransferase/poly(A) polymerase